MVAVFDLMTSSTPSRLRSSFRAALALASRSSASFRSARAHVEGVLAGRHAEVVQHPLGLHHDRLGDGERLVGIEGLDRQRHDAGRGLDVDVDPAPPVPQEPLDRLLRVEAGERVDAVPTEPFADREIRRDRFDHRPAVDVLLRDERFLGNGRLDHAGIRADRVGRRLVGRPDGRPDRELRLGHVAVGGDQTVVDPGTQGRQDEADDEQERQPGITFDVALVGAHALLGVGEARQARELPQRLCEHLVPVDAFQRPALGFLDLHVHRGFSKLGLARASSARAAFMPRAQPIARAGGESMSAAIPGFGRVGRPDADPRATGPARP
ncbi:hypothetical protein ACU4GA_29195 [Methylobacterium oryzae CBMB20]